MAPKAVHEGTLKTSCVGAGPDLASLRGWRRRIQLFLQVTCALKRKRCETLRPLFACLRCTRLGLKCAYDRKRAPGRIPTGGRRPKAIERVDALPLPPELSALAFELQKQEDQLESQSVSSSGWNWLPPSPTASDASIDISLVSVPTQLYSAASLFSAALDHSQCHPWPHLSSFKRDALLANLAKWHTKHSDSGLEDFDRLAALLFYHSASAVLVCPREHVPLNLFGWAGGEDCVAVGWSAGARARPTAI